MILRTRYSGDVEVRAAWPDRTRPPGRANFGRSGVPVTLDNAVGLPAVGRAHRLVCGLVASLCLDVYEGKNADKKPRAETPQGKLFSNPVAGMSLYDWLWDVASSLEATENALLLKAKDNKGVVRELVPVPAQAWRGEVDKAGRKVFDVVAADGKVIRLDSSQALHLRGQTVGGGAFGVSRILQHADPLGSQLAAQRFEGAYLRNHARPDVAIIFPQGVTREQAAQWREEWDALYGGADNAGRVVPLGGGATIQPIPLSLRDAQFVESKGINLVEAGQIMDVDPVLLGSDPEADKKAALDYFLKVQFMPRLRRLEEGFRGDLDLFPVGSPLYLEFEELDRLFIDAETRSKIEHEEIQDGRSLVNELRAARGKPPLPPVPADWTQDPGNVPQITPVGGAPNPVGQTQPTADTADRGFSVPSIELRVDQNMEPLAREQGLAYANFSTALDSFAEKLGGVLERFADVDAIREKRSAEAQRTQDELARAQAEALRAVGQPNIVVNVEPTPVTVENTVNMDPIPVQLTLEMPAERNEKKTVKFDRNGAGAIVGATITEVADG